MRNSVEFELSSLSRTSSFMVRNVRWNARCLLSLCFFQTSVDTAARSQVELTFSQCPITLHI